MSDKPPNAITGIMSARPNLIVMSILMSDSSVRGYKAQKHDLYSLTISNFALTLEA